MFSYKIKVKEAWKKKKHIFNFYGVNLNEILCIKKQMCLKILTPSSKYRKTKKQQ